MKYWKKRVLSLVLCVALLVTAIPQQVYANVQDTVHNTDEENLALLQELRQIGGNSVTAEAVIQDLQNMGLLDDEGALVTSTQIMVDGTAMSLAEVKALIDAPGTDLGKKVSVEGQEITLKSLQTMLEIEEELARIEAEYFSGCDVEITDEHKKTYASLLDYLENNQLVLETEEEVSVNHDGRIKVTQDNSAADKVIFTFTLVDKNNTDIAMQPTGYEVTAEYTTLDGSALAGKHYTAVSGTIKLNTANSFTATVEVPKISIDTTDESSLWDGIQSFYFYVGNPVNALLLSDSGEEYARTFKVELQNTYTWSNSDYDGKVTVESITVPEGIYIAGSTIPITVTYSQPIHKKRTVELYYYDENGYKEYQKGKDYEQESVPVLVLENGTELQLEEADSTSRRFTFLYKVPEAVEAGTKVLVASVKGGYSVGGEEEWYGNVDKWGGIDAYCASGLAVPEYSPANVITIEGVSMEPAKQMAFSGVTTDQEEYEPTDTVKVTLNIDKRYSNWLDSNTMTMDGSAYLAEVYLKAGQYTYPLMLDPETTGEEEGTKYIAEIAALDYAGLEATENRIEIYYGGTYDGTTKTFSGGNLAVGTLGSFKVKPVIAITGITLDEEAYPEGNKLYKMAETATGLKIKKITLSDGTTCTPEELEGKATFPEIQWYSGDTDMAVINEDTGFITVKTNSAGTVQFQAVAQNNGFKMVTVPTPFFAVEAGGPPNVIFQQGSDTFIADRKEKLTLQWVETVTAVEGYENASFTIELFEGDYKTKEALKAAEENSSVVPIESWPITGSSAQYTIPANILDKVSQNNVPVYTVRVSTINPNNSSTTLSTIAHIVVIPKPAKVRFAKLENYYLLDTAEAVNIHWTLEEYTGGEFSFSVKKNGVPFDEENTGNIGSDSSTYQLKLDSVPEGTLKDVYTVTVKTKNTTDTAYSTDSFLLHVYDADALKLWIDGKEPGKTDASYQYTMDNNADIAKRYGAGGSAAILALQRNIALKNTLSINYKDYPYGAVTDQIAWDDGSSQAEEGTYGKVASINYPASSYTDVMDMGYSSFRPSTEFLLAGLKDGETKITATHAQTGQKLTLDLSVKTLKDKLYLFQFYPAQTTHVSYINGDGEKVELDSNDRGELAIYEEKGIATDITLSSGSGKELYLGTLYQKDLVTREGNAAHNELYPQNNFKLRKAATLELYIKDVNGKPYTGDITYRGAVFKNGVLCADTMTGATQEIGGTSYGDADAATITLNEEGKFELIFDATRFWTEENNESLKVTDEIAFIYEVQFAGNAYYPQLITVNGNINAEDVADFGENIVTIKECQAEEVGKPFISESYVDYGLRSGRLLDVTYFTGSIGATDQYKKAELLLCSLLWGTDPADGNLTNYEMDVTKVTDNRRLSRQSQKVYSYPFSTMLYLNTVVSLDPESTGLKTGEQVNAQVRLQNDAGFSKVVDLPYKLVNMIGVVAINESSDVEQQLDDIKQSGMKQYGMVDLFTGESFLNVGMSLVSKNNGASLLDNSVCQLKLVATEDPAIYRGIVLLNVDAIGETNRPMIDFPGEADERLTYKPTMLDVLKVATKGVGSWMDSQNATYKNVKAGKGTRDMGAQVAGYYECEVRYSYETGQWKLVTTGGGFTVSANMDYAWYANFWAGPVPVTMELAIGGIVSVDFKSTLPVETEKIPEGMSRDELNDYLTTLRIWFYIRAFAGVGIDYSVVALKIGIFGQVDVDNYNYFLNRNYISKNALMAQRTTLHAELGIKFLFKILFFSYEKTFASTDGIKVGGQKLGDGLVWETGDYEELENWMKKTDFPLAIPGYNATGGAGNTPLALSDTATYSLRSEASDTSGMTQVASDYSMESRDYLDKYARFWGDSGIALMALDEDNKLKNLQMNAYPYADPVVTRDGEWLAFISDQDSTDLNDTRACFTKKQEDGSYYISVDGEGNIVPSKEFPQDMTQEPSGVNTGADSDIVMDGNSSFAAAAWIRQSYEMAEAGSTPSSQDMTAMMNGSEIYASVLTDAASGTWTTTRLTNNGTPDLSPVVAAGNGKAVVAWRMTAGSSAYMGNDGIPVIRYDDRADSICYKIYENGSWGEVKTLYMGDLGKVKSLSASMMEDGTIAVAYTIDTDTAGALESGMGYEAVVSIIGNDGEDKDMIRLTTNNALDQGIQVAAVAFPDGAERFVTAWYYGEKDASGSTTTDLHFLALKKDGSCETDFVDALSDLSATTGAAVTEKFAFAKGDHLTLDNLTLLWSEPILAYDEENGSEAQADGLKAVKFCYETVSDTDNRISRIYLTPALDVADMGVCTTIDHFESYVDANVNGGTRVHGVLLNSIYAGELEQVVGNVYTVEPVAQMQTATADFENKIQVEGITYDRETLTRGGRMAVAFNIANIGFKPVQKFIIKIGDNQEKEITLTEAMIPNSKQTQSCIYDVPQVITDADYTITAEFSDGSTASATGTLNLDVPELKVSTLEMGEWGEGIRTYTALLANSSDVELASDDNRRVYLGVFSEANCEEESMVAFKAGDTAVDAGVPYKLTQEELKLLDKSSLVIKLSYDIREDLVDETFPEDGITLYTKIWAEENTSDTIGYESYEVINEFDSNNNQRSISFYDPVAANEGISQGLTVEQENNNGITTARVTVRNLSMKPSSNGNLVVSLLNEKNQVIETKLYAQDAEHLISLSGEQSMNYTVSFASAGTRVKADYFTVDSADWQNQLAAISIDGAALVQTEAKTGGFSPEVMEYSAATLNRSSATVQAAAKSLNATVTIQMLKNTHSGETWYTAAEGTGAATTQVPLSYSDAESGNIVNEMKVIVTPKDEQADTLTYKLHITSEHSQNGTIILTSDQTLQSGWTNSREISISTKSEGVDDFVPAMSEYRINQGKWIQTGTGSITNCALNLNEDGKYLIEARMEDKEGYRRGVEELEIMVDRTAPMIDSEKLIFIETQEELEKEEEENTTLLSSVFSLFRAISSDGNSKYRVKVNVPVWDCAAVTADANPAAPTDTSSGIASVSVVAGTKTYPMTLEQDSEGNYVYSGVISSEYRGTLTIQAADLAGNTSSYSTDEIVISDSIGSSVASECEVTTDSITITGSVTLNYNTKAEDLKAYGIRFRKGGETEAEWQEMTEQAGSCAESFCFTAANLDAGCKYEYQIYTRLITENENHYGSSQDCRTQKKAGTVANRTDGNGYAAAYTFTDSAITAPVAANFTTNSGSTGYTFTWYEGAEAAEDRKLTGTPSAIGNYTLQVDVSETDSYTAAKLTIPVEIAALTVEAEAILSDTNSGSNGWYRGNVTIKAPEGYQISKKQTAAEGGSFRDELTVSADMNGDYSYYLKQATTGYITEEKKIAVKRDTIAPEGEITIRENGFKSFLHTISFGLFFKNSVDVKISAEDTGDVPSGIGSIEYQKVAKDGTYDADGEWISKSSLSVQAEEAFVLYARITDKAGNVTVINSEGVVVYRDSAQKTQSISYTRTTKQDVSAEVTLNGNTVDKVTIRKAGTAGTAGNTADNAGTAGNTADNAEAAAASGSAAAGAAELTRGSDYTLNTEGNVLTLTGNYLDTLPAGNYTLTVSYHPLGIVYQENKDSEGKDLNEAPAATDISLKVVLAEGSITGIKDPSRTYDASPVETPDFETTNDIWPEGSVKVEYKPKAASDNDYTVTAPTDAGDYIVRVTVAEDAYHKAASATAEFTIAQKNISGAEVKLGSELTYNGTEQVQTIESVTVDGLKLTAGDYTADGDTVTDAGDYALTLTGKGNFTGTANEPFTVKRAAAPSIADIERSYVFAVGSKDETISIDLAELLPDDRGATDYVLAANDAAYVLDEKVDEKGILTYRVGTNGKAGDVTTLTVTAAMKNYADTAVKVKVSLTEIGSEPTYLVTIPATVELGGTATVGASGVNILEESQLVVKLTDNQSFKLTNAEGAELKYSISKGSTVLDAGSTVLTVAGGILDNADRAELTFSEPEGIRYSGEYKGIVSFTLSVETVSYP